MHSGWAALHRWGFYSDSAVYHGAFWALLTGVFVHIEPLHLLFNLYWAWILGQAFEARFGSLRLLLFILTSAFVSSGLQLASGEMGIGLSGVGYALFGIAWAGRKRFPEFARVVNDQTVRMFVGWGILCVITTYIGVMKIGNVAHLTGLMFGALVGGLLVWPNKRWLLAVGLAAMAALSVVPLFWNPLSLAWVSERAMDLHRARKGKEAIRYYKRSMELGADKSWAWENIALVESAMEDEAGYNEALTQLGAVDPEAAARVKKEMEGSDDENSSGVK